MFGNTDDIDEYELKGNVPERKPWHMVLHGFLLLVIIYIFLFSIEIIGAAFLLLSKDITEQIILATASPFIALFIGLLTTVIIQSSSTTTSMIVAVVATGSLSIESAVPMIMGANIGTTVTSTFMALGHISRVKEFRRAIAAGTVHDIFNILTAIIIFPLEYYFNFLSASANYITSYFDTPGDENGTVLSPVTLIVKPVVDLLSDQINRQPYILLPLGVLILFFSIKGLASQFNKLLMGSTRKQIDQSVFGSRLKSLAWGIGATAVVQSSSVTTSMIVPIVAYGKLTLKNAFPFVIGANIGTTLTALLAAATRTESAVSIALVHLIFNLLGAVIFYFVPYVRLLPIALAKKLGASVAKKRVLGFLYILCAFFILPFFLIYATGSYVNSSTFIYEEHDKLTDIKKYAVVVNALMEKNSIGLQKEYADLPQYPDNLESIYDHSYTRRHVGFFRGKIEIDSITYLLRPKGSCYPQRDDTTCIVNRVQDYTEAEYYTPVCYVFRTEHADGYVLDYLDPSTALVLRKEWFDTTGVVIRSKYLIDINEK